MLLRSVDIRQFRNIAQAHLDCSSQLTLVVGKNAQGKTNALDAIHIALQGKSFRNSPELEWFSFVDPDVIAITASLDNGQGRLSSIEHRVMANPHKRIHRGPKIPVVVFSPQDLALSKGSPSDRRRFLDQTISLMNARYDRALKQFQHAVLQRNRALKEPRLSHIVDSFNPALVSYGTYVWQTRQEFVLTLLSQANVSYRRISNGESLGGHLQYGGCQSPIASEAEYLTVLEQRRTDERLRMMTLVGPHRDDLALDIGGRSVSLYASQGQHRLVSLSLKLATFHLLQEEFGEPPVILLDDVLSELDSDRRGELLRMISQKDQQTIVTDTEARNYEYLSPMIYHVDNGSFTKWGQDHA